MADSSNVNVLTYGDLVSFYVDDIGYFASPHPLREPPPEKTATGAPDPITHLRIIQTSQHVYPPEFNIRCVFQILNDKSQAKNIPITYGSNIRLCNVVTKQFIVASNQDDTYDSKLGFSCVFLKKSLGPGDELASQWQVVSRYKLRLEGSPVFSKDYLLLKNVQYKTKTLSICASSNAFPDPGSSEKMMIKRNDLLVGMKIGNDDRLGWRISILQKHFIVKDDKIENDNQCLPAGAFVRFIHQEVKGHLLCKIDDSQEMQCDVNPLGNLWYKLLKPLSNTCSVCVRTGNAEKAPSSPTSIWQITFEDIGKRGTINSGNAVRLRHLLTGQYLCIREINKQLDTHAIMKNSKFKKDPIAVEESGMRKINSRTQIQHPHSSNSSSKVTVVSDRDKEKEIEVEPPDASRKSWFPLKFNLRGKSPNISSPLGDDDNLGRVSDSSGDGVDFAKHQLMVDIDSLVVATTDVIDDSSVFIIESVDSIKASQAIANGVFPISLSEHVFFKHRNTRLSLELKSLNTKRLNFKESLANPSNIDLSSSGEWIEYVQDDYLVPSRMDSSFSVLGEVYNVQIVPDNEIQDTLYAVRYNNLVKAAISSLQHSENMNDDLYLPLFRQLNVGLYSLYKWSSGQCESEYTMESHPTYRPIFTEVNVHGDVDGEEDENENDKLVPQQKHVALVRLDSFTAAATSANPSSSLNYKQDVSKLSSMNPWIGRGIQGYSRSMIPKPIISPRKDKSQYSYVPFRQNCLSETKLVDLLIWFAMIVFRLIRIQVKEFQLLDTASASSVQDNSKTGRVPTKANMEELFHVPDIITGSCSLIQDIIHAAIFRNKKNALRVVAAKNNLLALMDFEIVGWKPPIESLLSAVQMQDASLAQNANVDMSISSSVATKMAEFDTNSILQFNDLLNLVRKMYFLFVERDLAAIRLLNILTVICSPDQASNKKIQNKLIEIVFKTKHGRANEILKDLPEGIEAESLLFSTRNVRGTNWQVHFGSDFLSSEGDNEDNLKLLLKSEISYLHQIFHKVTRMNSNDNVKLTKDNVIFILEILGLAGVSLYEESIFLENANFAKFCGWWFSKRKIYFPSSYLILNEPKSWKKDLKTYCIDQIRQYLISADSKLLDQESIFFDYSQHGLLPLRHNYDSDVENRSEKRARILLRVPNFDIGDMQQMTMLLSAKSTNLLRKALIMNDNTTDSQLNNDYSYNGMSILLNISMTEAKRRIQKQSAKHSTARWEAVMTVLAVNSFERDWLLASFALVSTLCACNNIFGQMYASRLLPAELLLDILLYANQLEKAIVCNLMINLYVEHDMVFAVTGVTCGQAKACSIYEIDLNAKLVAGRVFNDMTRFLNRHSIHASDLRKKLWNMLRTEFSGIVFVHCTADETKYVISLLRLTKYLIQKGFFEESEQFSEEFQSLQGEILTQVTSSPHSTFSLFSNILRPHGHLIKFDVEEIEKCLVEKLLFSVEKLKNDYSEVKEGVLRLLKDTKDTGGMSEEEFKSVRYRIQSNPQVISIGAENFSYASQYFDSIFSNADNAVAVSVVVEILSLIFDIQQFHRVKNITSVLTKQSQLRGSGKQAVVKLKLSRQDERRVVELFRVRSLSKSVTESLLISSLYSSQETRYRIYQLLFKQLLDKEDVCKVLDQLTLVVYPSESIMWRVITNLRNVILSYYHELETTSTLPKDFILNIMSFCFQTIKNIGIECKRLCDDPTLPINGFHFNDTPLTVSNGAVDGEGVRIPSYNLELVHVDKHFNLLEAYMMFCDVDNDPSNKLGTSSVIIELTCYFNAFMGRPMGYLSRDIMKKTLEEFIVQLNRITQLSFDQPDHRHGPYREWSSFTVVERFFVVNVLDLCGACCLESDIMVAEICIDLFPMCTQYLWFTPGANLVVELCCKYCTIDSLLLTDDDIFLKNIFDKFAAVPVSGNVHISSAKIIYSLITNATNSSTMITKILGMVNDYVLCNGSLRGFIVIDGEIVSQEELEFHYCLVKIICAAYKVSSKNHSMMTMYDANFRSSLSKEVCKEMLFGDCPLQIKSVILNFAFNLYGFVEFSFRHIVLKDLDKIISISNHNNPKVNFASAGNAIFDYVDEIITLVEQELFMSNIFEDDSVNAFITASRRKQQSTLIDDVVMCLPFTQTTIRLTVSESTKISAIEIEDIFECVKLIFGVMRLPIVSKLIVDRVMSMKQVFDRFTRVLAAVNLLFESIYRNPKERSPDELLLGRLLNEFFMQFLEWNALYESQFSEDYFTRVDGFDLFRTAVSKILLPPQIPHKKIYSKEKHFLTNFEFLPQISEANLKKAPCFQFLRNKLDSATIYLERGGLQLVQKTHRAIKETDFLRSLNDFEKWMFSGGRYIQIIISFLATNAEPDDVASTLLHILCTLLNNSIDNIRSSKKPLKVRTVLVQAEIQRLQRLQDAMGEFGVGDLVLNLMGRALTKDVDDKYVTELAPLALKLGFQLLASGNDSMQHDLMTNYKTSIVNLATADFKNQFVASLRWIMRKIIGQINVFIQLKGTAIFPFQFFKILIKVFSFCGSLCSGHNNEARLFLHDQHRVGESMDLVKDIASCVYSLMLMLTEYISYISFEQFYERIAPFVWKNNPDVKRRFICWHDDHVDYELVSQLLFTMTAGFDALTEVVQGPCVENQPSALLAIPLCTDLLEYLGAMKLKATSILPGKWGDRMVTWNGGNPAQFYATYESELSRIGRFQDDPQFEIVREKRKQWAASSNFLTSKGMSSYDIIGIDINLLQWIGRESERSCLRFLLALLEGSSSSVTEQLSYQFNDGIMLQNMENVYKLSFEVNDSSKSVISESAVNYLTLISTMASALREDPSVIIDDLLLEWKIDNAKKGFRTDALLASIEIISSDNSVQRVYFAIPEFVITYWKYPEVQKAKDKLLWEVSRESAEDKLSDLYARANALIQVMRRQEKLKTLLTRPIHTFFGGYNSWLDSYLPSFFKLRPMLFALTVALTVLYAYLSYRDQHPWIVHSQRYFEEAWNWQYREQALTIVRIVHSCMCGFLLVRELINSPAADGLEDIHIPGMESFPPLQYLSSIISYVRDIFLIILSVSWPLLVLGFSLLAFFVSPYFYSPVLLDIVPQIRLTSFLLDAVVRNLSRIFSTLLLAVIFLYLYAVLMFTLFRNQYGLGGFSDCNDLVSCFLLHLDYGLSNPPEWINEGFINPDFGDVFDKISIGPLISVFAGTTFNFSYVILINLVLQAIISGLIIDAFSSMREENDSIEKDIYEKCFICDISRDEFEQAGIPFEEHVKEEHNMWHYVWFMIYLESKDPLTFTGPEQYCYQNFKDKNGFVKLGPIRKSLSLERKAGAIDTITIATLSTAIAAVAKTQNSIQSTVKDIADSQLRLKKAQADLEKKIVSKIDSYFTIDET